MAVARGLSAPACPRGTVIDALHPMFRHPLGLRAWEHQVAIAWLHRGGSDGLALSPLADVLARLLSSAEPGPAPSAYLCSPLHSRVRHKLIDLAHDRLSAAEAQAFLKEAWDHLAGAAAALRQISGYSAEKALEAVRSTLGALQQLGLYFKDPRLERLETATRLWTEGMLTIERHWTEEVCQWPSSLRRVNAWLLARRSGFEERVHAQFSVWLNSLRTQVLRILAGSLRAHQLEWEMAEEILNLLQFLAAPPVHGDVEGIVQRLDLLLEGLEQPVAGNAGDEFGLTERFLRLARLGECPDALALEVSVVLERAQWLSDQLLLESMPDEEEEPANPSRLAEIVGGLLESYAEWRQSGGLAARRALDEFAGWEEQARRFPS